MEVFIGIILGFIIAIIVMIVTGFGQDYELITTIDELQKELKDNKDRLKNKEIAEIRATFFARKIKEIEDIIKNSEESKVFEKERKQYQEVINKYIPIVESMTVENVNEVMDLIKNIDDHILTSEKEIKDHFAKKIKELNLVWNKDKQQYEVKQEAQDNG